MKKSSLTILLLFLVISLSSLPASAFQYSGYKWEDADIPLTYRINTTNRPAWFSLDSFVSIIVNRQLSSVIEAVDFVAKFQIRNQFDSVC
jgi:hypothetical protein